MADICAKCGKMITNDWTKRIEEKNGELYEFHNACFDFDEFYDG